MRWLLAGFVLFAAFSCGEEENKPSNDITALKASKSSNIIFGEEVILTASSFGSTFQWSCNGGTLRGEGNAVIWIAPDSIGVYIISVDNGAGSKKTISVSVVGEKVPEPDIYSLSASKSNDIIFGETITLTATSQGTVFQWSCDGGNIVGEGKSAKWIAPNTVGNYTVSVSNGENSTKSVELKVVGSFFYSFDKSSSDFGLGNSNTKATVSGGKVTVSSTSTADALFVRKELSQPNIPFSFKTKVAINASDYMNIGGKGVGFYIMFADSQIVNTDFLKAIHLTIYPGTRAWRVSIGIKNTEGVVSYSQQTNKLYDIFTENNQYHTIGMSVTEDKKLVVNVDGMELYRLDISGYVGEFKLDGMAYQVSSGLSLLIDDFYFTNDGTILK